MDAVSLGQLYAQIGIDTTDYYAGLGKLHRDTIKVLSDIEDEFNKLDFSLKINVNDSRLTDLNKHFDLKEKHYQHLGEVLRKNKLTPKTNLKELTELKTELSDVEKQLDRIHGKEASTVSAAPRQAAKVGQSGMVFDESRYRSRVVVQQQGKGVTRTISDSIVEGIGSSIGERLTEAAIDKGLPSAARLISNRLAQTQKQGVTGGKNWVADTAFRVGTQDSVSRAQKVLSDYAEAQARQSMGIGDSSREGPRAVFTEAEMRRFSKFFTKEFELAGERTGRRMAKAIREGDAGGVFGAVGKTITELPGNMLRATAQGAGEYLGRRVGESVAQKLEGQMGDIQASMLKTFGDIDSLVREYSPMISEELGDLVPQEEIEQRLDRVKKAVTSLASGLQDLGDTAKQLQNLEELGSALSAFSDLPEKAGGHRQSKKIKQSAAEAAAMAKQRAKTVAATDQNVVFMTGGFAGKQGMAGIEAAPVLQEILGETAKVIGFANSSFDVQADAAKDQAGWMRDVAAKIAELAARGYNPDAVRLASEVAAYRQQNPEAKITLAGHSAGGLVSQEAAAILEEMGISEGIQTLTFGTPDLGFVPKPKSGLTQVIGEGDAFKALSPNQRVVNAAGHESAKYFASQDFRVLAKELVEIAAAGKEVNQAIKEVEEDIVVFQRSYQALIKQLSTVAGVSNRVPEIVKSKNLGAAGLYMPSDNQIKVDPKKLGSIVNNIQKDVSEMAAEELAALMQDLSTIVHESFHGGQAGFSGLTTAELSERGKAFVKPAAPTVDQSNTLKAFKGGQGIDELTQRSLKTYKQNSYAYQNASAEQQKAMERMVADLEYDAYTFQAKFLSEFLKLATTMGQQGGVTIAEVFDAAIKEIMQEVSAVENQVSQQLETVQQKVVQDIQEEIEQAIEEIAQQPLEMDVDSNTSSVQRPLVQQHPVKTPWAKKRLADFDTDVVREVARATGRADVANRKREEVVEELLKTVEPEELLKLLKQVKSMTASNIAGMKPGQKAKSGFLQKEYKGQQQTEIAKTLKQLDEAISKSLETLGELAEEQREDYLKQIEEWREHNLKWVKEAEKQILSPQNRMRMNRVRRRMTEMGQPAIAQTPVVEPVITPEPDLPSPQVATSAAPQATQKRRKRQQVGGGDALYEVQTGSLDGGSDLALAVAKLNKLLRDAAAKTAAAASDAADAIQESGKELNEAIENLVAKGEETVNNLEKQIDENPATAKGEAIVKKGQEGIQKFAENNLTPKAIAGKLVQNTPLKGFADQIQDLNIPGLIEAFVAFNLIFVPIVGLVGKYGEAMTEAAMRAEKFENIVRFSTGSLDAAGQSIAFVRGEVSRLNLDLNQARDGYAGLVASTRDTSFEGAQTDQIFSGLAQAASAYQLDNQSTDRLFLATEQIIGKNTVSSEELRQQMGEVLPGAFQIAARATGKTTQELNKLLESGRLVAEDFIPKFVQQLSAETSTAVVGAANSATASINRFNTSVTEIQETFGKPLLVAKKIGLDVLSSGINQVNKAAGLLTEVLAFLALAGFAKTVQGAQLIIGWLMKQQVVVAILSKAWKSFLGFLIPILKTLAINFAVFSAIVDVVQIFSKAFEDGGGAVRDFATQSTQQLDKLNDVLKETTASSVALADSYYALKKAPSLIEQTAVGGVAGLIAGDEGKALVGRAERGVQGSLNPLALGPLGIAISASKALRGEDPTKLTTFAEKQANDFQIAIGDAMANVNDVYGKAFDMLGSGKGGAEIQRLQGLDRQLSNLQARRASLRPGDAAGKRQLEAEEEVLLAERQRAAKPVAALQGTLASYLEGLETTKKAIEQRLAGGGIPKEEAERLKGQLEQVNATIEQGQALQDRFGGLIGQSVDQVTNLLQGFQKVKAVLDDTNSRTELALSRSRRLVSQQIRTGQVSEFQGGRWRGEVENQGLRDRIAANKKAMAEFQAYLDSTQVTGALEIAGINSLQESGPNQIRLRASGMAEGEQKKTLEETADRYEQLQQLQSENARMKDELEQSALNAQKQLRETAEQINSFYRSIQRDTEQLALETKQANLDIAINDAKTKLQQALTGFGNKFFGEFTDGLVSLLDQLFEPMRNALNAQQQISQLQNQLQDTLMQGNEMARQFTPGGAMAPGAVPGQTVDFSGVRVTSARDASGEPGLDYVVRGGRGANFGSLTAGEVIQTVTDQNWESHLESAGRGGGQRRGYGNRVVVRTVDEVTGQFVDILYAHLDKVAAQVGQQVGVGTVLGTQGRTGSTTGAHVSADFFGAGSRRATPASLRMRDRVARELQSGGNNLNRQISQAPVAAPAAMTASATSGAGNPRMQRQISATLEPAFLDAVRAMAGRLRTNPEWLVAAMGFETGGTFSPSQRNQAGSGATGLIQFMPGTARGMGTSTGQLARMSRMEQLQYVERYLQPYAGRLNSLEDVYASILYPSAMGRGAGYNLPNWAYGQNQGLDINRDRRISMGEATEKVREYLPSAQRLLGTTGRSPASRGMAPTPMQANASGFEQQASSTINQSMVQAGANAQARVNTILEQTASVNSQVRVQIEQSIRRTGRSLERGVQDLQDTTRTYERSQEDIRAQLGDATPTRELQASLNNIDREFADRTRELRLNIREAEEGLQDLRGAYTSIQEQSQQFPQLASLLPGTQQAITQTEQELNQLRSLLGEETKLYEDRRKDTQRRFQLEEEARRLAARQRVVGTQRELTDARAIQMRRTGRGLEAIDAEGVFRTEELNLGFRARIREQEELLRTQQLTNKEFQQMKKLLEELNATNLDNLQAELEQQREELNWNSRSQVFQTETAIGSEVASGYRNMGFERQARQVERDAAIAQTNFDMESQIRQIDQAVRSNQMLASAAEKAKNNIRQLGEIRLDNLNDQFSVMGELMPGLQQSFQGFFSSMISGSASIEDAFIGLVQSIADQLTQLATQFLVNELFGGLFGVGGGIGGGKGKDFAGVLGGLAGGGGGGGGLGDGVFGLVGGILGMFREGGVVESMPHGAYRQGYGAISEALKKEGSSSILATLTPGELVLPVDTTQEFFKLGLDKVLGFSQGGVVPGASASVPKAKGMSTNFQFNMPISVEGGGAAPKFDEKRLQKAIRNLVITEIAGQKTPGGELYAG